MEQREGRDGGGSRYYSGQYRQERWLVRDKEPGTGRFRRGRRK